ncbi:MAG: twitching motility protein PilT [Methanobacteriota archaeon]|nr:MAG: twitching motility protein PilT [Euryarchaeota archaeon]
MKAVVLDANALLMPFQFRLNLDREIARLLGDVPVFVPSSVLDELSGLEDADAQAAAALAAKYEVAQTDMCGDEGVVDVASRLSAAVVTNDRALISKLKSMRIPALRLRSGRYLVMVDTGTA